MPREGVISFVEGFLGAESEKRSARRRRARPVGEMVDLPRRTDVADQRRGQLDVHFDVDAEAAGTGTLRDDGAAEVRAMADASDIALRPDRRPVGRGGDG